MNRKTIIIIGAGLITGIGEALIYYNMGKSQGEGKGFKFKMPPKKELIKTTFIVLFTSLLTAGITEVLEKAIPERSVRLAKA